MMKLPRLLDELLNPSPAAMHSRWRRHWLKATGFGLSLGILALAVHEQQITMKAFVSSQQQYQQQQGAHQTAQSAAGLLALYQAHYDQLHAQGVIGDARRLQWVEALNASANQLGIPQVRFTLAATAAANETNTFFSAEGLGLTVTPMRLDFSLVHEGDFYRLIADLRSRAQGLFSVQNCAIRRKQEASTAESVEQPTGENEVASERIAGECDLIWYNLAAISSVAE
ncbi:MAG TPA: hypothetical protein VIZ65_05815 [Cellvibrionaceae bacterium]